LRTPLVVMKRFAAVWGAEAFAPVRAGVSARPADLLAQMGRRWGVGRVCWRVGCMVRRYHQERKVRTRPFLERFPRPLTLHIVTFEAAIRDRPKKRLGTTKPLRTPVQPTPRKRMTTDLLLMFLVSTNEGLHPRTRRADVNKTEGGECSMHTGVYQLTTWRMGG